MGSQRVRHHWTTKTFTFQSSHTPWQPSLRALNKLAAASFDVFFILCFYKYIIGYFRQVDTLSLLGMWWERLRHNILQSFSCHVPHLYGQCLCRAGVSLIPDTHFTQSVTKPADSTSKSLPSVTSPRLYCTWPSSRCRLAQAPVKLLLPWSVGYLTAEAMCSKCMCHHAPLLLSETWRLPPYALRIEFKFFHSTQSCRSGCSLPSWLTGSIHRSLCPSHPGRVTLLQPCPDRGPPALAGAVSVPLVSAAPSSLFT